MSLIATIRQSLTVDCPDTWMEDDNPYQTHGSDQTLYLGNYGAGNKTRILIEFPISTDDVPPGAVIDAAEVDFKVISDASSSGPPGKAYRIRRTDWDAAKACWINYKLLANWTVAGCGDSRDDYYLSPSVAWNLSNGQGAWWNVTGFKSLVDEAIDDDRVLRLLFRLNVDGGSSNWASFRSGNYGTFTDRPKLIIHYTLQRGTCGSVIAPGGRMLMAA